MVFNKALPANSTKIREYPTVLTDNWAAIAEGDTTFAPWATNYVDRTTLVGPPAIPAQPTDAVIVFCRQDVAGQPELYWRDPSMTGGTDLNRQLTNGGDVGVTTALAGTGQNSLGTTYQFRRFTHDVTTYYNQDNFTTAWGYYDGAAVGANPLVIAATAQIGFASCTRTATGRYTLVFSVPMTSANYAVMLTVQSTSRRVIAVRAQTAAQIEVGIDEAGSATASNEIFYVAILGGR